MVFWGLDVGFIYVVIFGVLVYIMNVDVFIGIEVIEGYNGFEGGFYWGYWYLESNLFCIYEYIVLNNILKF